MFTAVKLEILAFFWCFCMWHEQIAPITLARCILIYTKPDTSCHFVFFLLIFKGILFWVSILPFWHSFPRSEVCSVYVAAAFSIVFLGQVHQVLLYIYGGICRSLQCRMPKENYISNSEILNRITVFN